MFGDQVSIGSLTSLAIHEYIYFIEIELFKNYCNFNIEVNGDSGKSNLEHHVKEAATLAMTTV